MKKIMMISFCLLVFACKKSVKISSEQGTSKPAAMTEQEACHELGYSGMNKGEIALLDNVPTTVTFYENYECEIVLLYDANQDSRITCIELLKATTDFQNPKTSSMSLSELGALTSAASFTYYECGI